MGQLFYLPTPPEQFTKSSSTNPIFTLEWVKTIILFRYLDRRIKLPKHKELMPMVPEVGLEPTNFLVMSQTSYHCSTPVYCPITPCNHQRTVTLFFLLPQCRKETIGYWRLLKESNFHTQINSLLFCHWTKEPHMVELMGFEPTTS